MNQRQLFLQHVAQTSPAPLALEIVKAEGCTLWDIQGKSYLDLISGISVCNMGHRHPKVVAAIKDQSDKYLHLLVYGEFVETPQVAYATFLTNHLPSSLDCIYSQFCRSNRGAMNWQEGKWKTEIVALAFLSVTQGY
jgi:4-aminobutyrate aminotransferase-like enzyme